MSIIRVRHDRQYTCIDNKAIRDKRLSFKARGLHHLLMSYPDDWQVSISHLCNESDKDGRTAIATAVKELEAQGYIQRYQQRSEAGVFGTFEYVVFELPTSKQPRSGNPQAENLKPDEPRSGNPQAEYPPAENLKQLSTDLNEVLKERSNTPLTPQRGNAIASKESQSEDTGNQQASLSDQQAKQSGKSKKRKKAASQQTSEQILALLPEAMQQRFDKFWSGYTAFCNQRQAKAGAKKAAVVSWRFLVESDFCGKGLDVFDEGVKAFVRLQGDRSAGIPHACRFLYSSKNSSGAWEDALEQMQSQGRSSDLAPQISDRGHAPPIVTAADFISDDQEYGPPSPEIQQKLQKIRTGREVAVCA